MSARSQGTNFACGIDFGTSNSTIALSDAERAWLIPVEGAHRTLPSAVFWETDGTVPLVGRAAIEAYVRGEDGRLLRGLKSTLGTSLINEKTRVGVRAVAFIDILGAFFRQMKARLDAVAEAGISSVVLGRPVHFVDDDAAGDAAAQAALEQIARKQGFENISFQYEPIAAALQYEQGIQAEELVLIMDIGGGTSDFSIVRVGPDRVRLADRQSDILANDGIRVGGTDLDRLLSLAAVMPDLGFLTPTGKGKGLMPRHYYIDLATWHRINMLYTSRCLTDLKALRHEADRPAQIDRLIRVVTQRHGHSLAMATEAAKIALSGAATAEIAIAEFTGGTNPAVTRAAFEVAVEAPVARIAGMLRGVLAQAGLAPAAIGTVFMTGGTSELPVLRRAVASELPGVAIVTGDMLGSVGTGLALDARRKFG